MRKKWHISKSCGFPLFWFQFIISDNGSLFCVQTNQIENIPLFFLLILKNCRPNLGPFLEPKSYFCPHVISTSYLSSKSYIIFHECNLVLWIFIFLHIYPKIIWQRTCGFILDFISGIALGHNTVTPHSN